MNRLEPTQLFKVVAGLLFISLVLLGFSAMATQGPATINSVWTDGARNFDLRQNGSKYKVKDPMTNSWTECDLYIAGQFSGYMSMTNCVVYKGSTQLGTLPTLEYNFEVINDILYLHPFYAPDMVVPFILVK